MSEQIEIRLFDGFKVYKDGEEILENLSNTRKTKLFIAYLMTNRDRAVTHQELFELLWSGEDYANPATALRTLLYRFRNMIEKEKAVGLLGAIISKKGTYQWNQCLHVSIDVLDFEAYAKVGLNKNEDEDTRIKALTSAIDIYKGSLLPDFCSEPWLISKASAYREMYIDVVESYISILKEKKDYSQIVELCDRAIELAGNSELITIEKSIASLRMANPNPKNADGILAYYNEYKMLNDGLQREMDHIQEELEDDMIEQKAYLCDYKTFKEIYRLQRRVQSRSKATIFLGIMDIRCDSLEDGIDSIDDVMKNVIECCQRQLRCGDSICHINDTQIGILFPAESCEDAVGVLERLKEASKVRIGDGLVVVYRVRPLKNAKE